MIAAEPGRVRTAPADRHGAPEDRNEWMLIEIMLHACQKAAPHMAPRACPASKSILRLCSQRVPAEVHPKRLFKHRVKRSPHRLSANIGRAARYVYGTVDIPADQVMNRMGNAKTVEAAQQILGQGGIPNTALFKGGKIGAAPRAGNSRGRWRRRWLRGRRCVGCNGGVTTRDRSSSSRGIRVRGRGSVRRRRRCRRPD